MLATREQVQTEIKLKCREGHELYAVIAGRHEDLLEKKGDLLHTILVAAPQGAIFFIESGLETCKECGGFTISGCELKVIDIQLAAAPISG